MRALRQRAFSILSDRGAVVTATELAEQVFGGPPRGPWRAILDAVMAGDPRFARAEDGWRIRTGSERTEDGSFVALALAASGPDPTKHRVVRIAAVAVRGGATIRFDVVLNPRVRLARYLSEAAGVTQEEAEEAPTFGEIVPQLRELLGDSPIVAYAAGWVAAMLEAELIRAESPGLANDVYELAGLAEDVFPTRGKPSLSGLAHQLGIDHPRPGHPPTDALISAAVARRVLESLGGLEGQRDVRLGARRDVVPFGTDREGFSGAPDSPGVYVIRDDDSHPLYVGKAANLRRRLRTYRSRPLALERRLEGLSVRAAAVSFIETGSDLEARLLEAALIREHRPPFNVQRRVRTSALLVRAAINDGVPRVRVSTTPTTDGATYIGPFKSERAARAHVQTAREVFPLAGLRRIENLEQQRGAVRSAVKLLAGQKREAINLLRAEMGAAAQRGEANAIERARRLIKDVLGLETRPWPLLGTTRDVEILVIEPAQTGGRHRAHHIQGGQLIASGDVAGDVDVSRGGARAVAASLRERPSGEWHHEDSLVVLRWLGELTEQHRVVRLRVG